MSSILIVDDDVEIRKTLRILLAGVGVILEASNGPDALRRIETEMPTVMLLDIAMPEMGGIAVLEAALEIDPSIAVLMLTGESDLAIAKDTLDIGARSYITKPFDAPALRSEVEQLMRISSDGGDPGPYRPWRVA